jgi:hypothetical protein
MRKKVKARRRYYERLTFKELCRITGITPRQRVEIGRYLKTRR